MFQAILAGVGAKIGGSLLEKALGPAANAIGDRVGGQLRDMFKLSDQIGRGVLDTFNNVATWPFKGMPFPGKPFHRCGPAQASTEGQALKTNGTNQIDTGRYLITVQEGECKIYDKQTNTWVKAHGDPHMVTSDGDKGQFHENLTIDLADGSKVTIKTTPKDANGVAWIDAVAVMKGDQAVVAAGLHDGQAGVQMGQVRNNAAQVDSMWRDGTVLRAGHEVDDLFYAGQTGEFRGSDPTQRWGEINLDGRGGVSRNSPDAPFFRPPFGRPPFLGPFQPAPGVGGNNGNGGANGAGGAEGANGAGGASAAGGGSIWDKLWDIIAQLQKKLEGKVNDLDKVNKDDEVALKKAFSEIQRLQDAITQLTNTMTNLEKSDHDSKMAVIRNFAG